jgi:N6-L-threonylcarbamoyladenine synthase
VRILGIETSCDETAAAVVEDGRRVRSSIVSSQVELHAPYGGVVPELASRAHVELVNPVVDEALMEAGVLDAGELDAIAACHGPGLAGALLVGVSAAKALALTTGLPYVQVNHLEAHLYAGWLEEPDLEPPLAVLIVSGGHTLLVIMEDHSRYRMMGQTVDDAAGEAFDKVARFLGLGYPGGPAIDRLAAEGDPDAISFPRAMRGEGYDFSFSGLKTAVVNHVRKHPEVATADVAASFQEAVVDVLTTKLVAAADEAAASTLVLGGGVAANSRLRARVGEAAEASGRRVFLPSPALCTDNGAMIAGAAWWRLRADGPTPLDAGVAPSLALPSI